MPHSTLKTKSIWVGQDQVSIDFFPCCSLISLLRQKIEILFYAPNIWYIYQGCTAKKVLDPISLEILLASFGVKSVVFLALYLCSENLGQFYFFIFKDILQCQSLTQSFLTFQNNHLMPNNVSLCKHKNDAVSSIVQVCRV